ncbi:PIG-L family deacetylase [Aquihabitans sp. McL0605]|uniref:PIG-L family deacetylase n=1 Tax=Aquihabitans sp. McL0605 TaxID=3415671 RepID=UPI003CF48871
MGTIVSFHAHPDDESIASGGTLALAAAAGHRTVLVFGTRGELGEPVPGVLAEGEQLTLRRTAEVFKSAEVLGVSRVEFLGWTDSGMMGEPTNDVPWCFWQADVEQAARRLATILEEEAPDVLTIYDDNGGYGHPDHIQVHRVGMRAAELCEVPVVAQGTMNRDLIQRAWAMAEEMGVEVPEPPDSETPPEGLTAEEGVTAAVTFGKAEADLTHWVDSSSVTKQKRASMLSHASQIGPDHFMAAMPDEIFTFVFGPEWYIVEERHQGEPPAIFTELFQPKPAA